MHASQWLSGIGKMKGNGEEAKRINTLLEAFKVKIFDCQRQLMIAGKDIEITRKHCPAGARGRQTATVE